MTDKRLVVRTVPEQPASSHGTRVGYDVWGCRCERCSAAERVHAVKQRAKDTAVSREGKALRGRA